MALTIPQQYRSTLTLKETEYAIRYVKSLFQQQLSEMLHLARVSAPLFVWPESGLNDDLNGVERPVSFGILEQQDKEAQIVHSLAKWKRHALARYHFDMHEGIYTDMNAIRRDEETSNIHSIYVDQWDWEKIIAKEERTLDTLKATVIQIYEVMKITEFNVCARFGFLETFLPAEITFVTTQEMEDRYPDKTAKEREYLYAKEYKAIFIMQIGGMLKSGKIHDGRAPDYDDWSLNGDIIVYYPILDIALELSSMGIRVDETSLVEQLTIRNSTKRLQLPFQQEVLNGHLPYTIGGGIGQSRLCMFFLRKAHIGEVQASLWPFDTIESCRQHGIELL